LISIVRIRHPHHLRSKPTLQIGRYSTIISYGNHPFDRTPNGIELGWVQVNRDLALKIMELAACGSHPVVCSIYMKRIDIPVENDEYVICNLSQGSRAVHGDTWSLQNFVPRVMALPLVLEPRIATISVIIAYDDVAFHPSWTMIPLERALDAWITVPLVSPSPIGAAAP
jgi:hypothetical protein